MAHVTVTDGELQVRLSTAEKVGGLLGDLRVPRTAVEDVAVEPDGFRALSGIRAPGLGIPGYRAIGTWRGKGRKAYVSLRRGVPALRVRLGGGGSRFDEVLVSTPDADALAQRLREN